MVETDAVLFPDNFFQLFFGDDAAGFLVPRV